MQFDWFVVCASLNGYIADPLVFSRLGELLFGYFAVQLVG
jgi:hypothetical protein